MVEYLISRDQAISFYNINNIIVILFIMMICLVSCSPPEDPVRCFSSKNNSNCTITNSYGAFPDRTICRAAEVYYPTTEEELISIVANATMMKRKMKVATRFSHSIPKLVCLDDQDGLLISTKNLNRVFQVLTDFVNKKKFIMISFSCF